MTTEKTTWEMSRRQVLTTAAVGVPAMGVLAATNMLGATPANAAPLATDGWWGSGHHDGASAAFRSVTDGLGRQPAGLPG